MFLSKKEHPTHVVKCFKSQPTHSKVRPQALSVLATRKFSYSLQVLLIGPYTTNNVADHIQLTTQRPIYSQQLIRLSTASVTTAHRDNSRSKPYHPCWRILFRRADHWASLQLRKLQHNQVLAFLFDRAEDAIRFSLFCFLRVTREQVLLPDIITAVASAIWFIYFSCCLR